MTSIALANGKGGVGKTSLSVSLAISLAEHGHSTLLVDADLGLANIDLILGLRPTNTLRHVVRDGVKLEDVVMTGPEGIGVISGGSGVKELVGLTSEQLSDLLSKINSAGSKYDFVVFDTASGLDESVMTFLRGSKRVLIVATPDPTSVMDAYATAKILFGEQPNANVSLIVNMADGDAHGGTVYERFKAIAGQFLNKEIGLAAVVPFDPAVAAALRSREAFILKSPRCKAAKAIDSLVDWLTSEQPAKESTPEDEKVSVLKRMRSVFAIFKKGEKQEEPAVEEAA
jgi:flagellar biosynthesis protein FlhG